MSKKNGKVFGVYLKEETAQKVIADSKNSQRTESNFIRILIENYYNQKELVSGVK